MRSSERLVADAEAAKADAFTATLTFAPVKFTHPDTTIGLEPEVEDVST